MSIREDIKLYKELSGEDGSQETIATIGAYLRGYRQGKEDAEPHWIPVTERLPEKEGRYLVTNSKIGAWHVDVDFYRPYMGGWMYDQGVTAWMPLPEPYKPTVPPECEGDCGWCKPSVIEKCKGVTE